METQKERAKARSSSGRVLLSLLLALVLGFGGYIGVILLLNQDSADDNAALQSSLPTGENESNLTGSTMQSLQSGGLVAIQGEDAFYINPEDGGSLYCTSRTGETTKLTDFAVANLNLRGEMLVFTDLNACALVGDDGKTVTLSASTHEELWNQAKETDRIRYGGHLYFIMGIESFCAGELSYEELTIVGVDSQQRYQAPILMENGGILMVVATPDSGAMAASARSSAPVVKLLSTNGGATRVAYASDSLMIVKPGEAMRRMDIDTSKAGAIQKAVVAGDKAFVHTFSIDTGKHTILMVDVDTGKTLGTLPGGELQSDGTNMYFYDGSAIFKYNPGTEKMTQVTQTPCDSYDYEVRPDGSVGYITKDSRTGEPVAMKSVPGQDGYIPSLDRSESEYIWNRRMASLLGKSYYCWDVGMKRWLRIDKEWMAEHIDGDTLVRSETIVPMGWGVDRRDIGPNAVQWLPPGELGDLFINNTPDPAPAPGPTTTSPDTTTTAPPSTTTAPEPTTSAPEPTTTPASQPSGGGSLSGFYLSTDNSQHSMEFHSDGTVDIFFSGASFTLDYSVSGSNISFQMQGQLSGVFASVYTIFEDGGVIDASGNIEVDYELFKKQ